MGNAAPINPNDLKPEQLSELVKIWSKTDRFILALTDCILKRMQNANTALKEDISKALEQSTASKGDGKKILAGLNQSIVETSADDFKTVAKIVSKHVHMTEDLEAIMGMIQQNIYLEKRLRSFREICAHICELTPENMKREEREEVFSRYGTSLGFIWKLCETHCHLPDDSNIFETIIYNKG